MSETLAHELYVFQTLWLNRLETRRHYLFNEHDKECVTKLDVLANALPDFDAVDSGGGGAGAASPGSARHQRDQWRKLGFENVDKPQTLFLHPPGVLALDCMAYFARNCTDTYTKLVLDQLSRSEEYACPFATTSVAIVQLLLEMLHVGEQPSDTDTRYLPIFYSTLEVFKELYCVGISLGCKTWREMEAKQVDFDRVLAVVRRQLAAVLERPYTDIPTHMDGFKSEVFQTTYSDILEQQMRQVEADREAQLESEGAQHMRDKLRKELLDVVKQQRVNQMCTGAWFNAISKGKIKDTSKIYVMLSANKKALHWSSPDSVEFSPRGPSMAELDMQCMVSDIKVFYVGKDVPSVHKAKKVCGRVGWGGVRRLADNTCTRHPDERPREGAAAVWAAD